MGLTKFNRRINFCRNSSSDEDSDEEDGRRSVSLQNLGFPGNPVKDNLQGPLPPLCKAIQDGSLNDLTVLLKSDRELVNTERFRDQPPLHFACHKRRIDLVKALLQFGAKVDAVDSYQNTALYVATLQAWPEGIKILLSHGAPATQLSQQTDDDNKNNCNNNNLLHSLLQSQRRRHPEMMVIECARLLIGGGLDVNCRNLSGESLVYCAALADYPLLVEKMLELNADPGLTTHCDRTVLHAACYSGSKKSLDTFLRFWNLKKLVTYEDKNGDSPFHLAVKSNSYECCLILLNNGDHLMNEDSRGDLRCELLEDMPSSAELYRKLFDSNITVSASDVHDQDLKIKFNYKCLIQQQNKVQCSPIYELMKVTDTSILEHPLIEHFLTYKWDCIKPLFYVKMLVYFIFLIVHSWYIIETYGRLPKKWSNSMEAFLSFQTVYLVLFFSFLIPDVLFMLLNLKRYLKQWETVTKFLTLATAAFIIFSPRVLSYRHIPQIVQTDASNNEIYYPIELKPLKTEDATFVLREDSEDINNVITFPTEEEYGGIPVVFPDDSLLSNVNTRPNKIPKIVVGNKIGLKPTSKPKSQSKKKKTIVITSRFGVSKVLESDLNENNLTDPFNATWNTYVPIETYTAAISAFLSWGEFMMIMAKVPSLGVYILIFTHVAMSLGKFLLAFSSLIIGFALTFHIIFKNLDAFGTVQGSIIKTLVMMIGEIEYGNLLETPTPFLSKCFLIIFLFSVTVLMANLLIGLTIEDIPKLKHQGIYMRLTKQASYLASYENLVKITKKIKCYPIYLILVLFRFGKFDIPQSITVYPNRDRRSKISSKVLKRVKDKWAEENECSHSVDDNVSYDFNNEFRHFKEQYYLDKQVLHKRLDELMAAVTNRSK